MYKKSIFDLQQGFRAESSVAQANWDLCLPTEFFFFFHNSTKVEVNKIPRGFVILIRTLDDLWKEIKIEGLWTGELPDQVLRYLEEIEPVFKT